MENQSRKTLVTSWILSGIAILFLLFDSIGKFVKPQAVIDGTVDLGYPVESITGIGAALFISTLLYIIPRFSFWGAVLLTGYMGGAIATHVRVGNPLFSHTLFPVYVAILVWGGLFLRNKKVRELFIMG